MRLHATLRALSINRSNPWSASTLFSDLLTILVWDETLMRRIERWNCDDKEHQPRGELRKPCNQANHQKKKRLTVEACIEDPEHSGLVKPVSLCNTIPYQLNIPGLELALSYHSSHSWSLPIFYRAGKCGRRAVVIPMKIIGSSHGKTDSCVGLEQERRWRVRYSTLAREKKGKKK